MRRFVTGSKACCCEVVEPQDSIIVPQSDLKENNWNYFRGAVSEVGTDVATDVNDSLKDVDVYMKCKNL